MAYYINYVFSEIEYDDTMFSAVFETWGEEDNVFCRFFHNRKTTQTVIWDNNKPIDDISPLPIHWLEFKLSENGKLNSREAKISY
ncbi:hypothetical protein [uncultured Ruminococcus sp.]|uniref:hypothetical protein n=1 Tax=uncultured Ruminococcus sp. TaxID=165186 RepID=UPI0026314F2D|nr:hypothetical protein [uncultured Ruminococcus sp.]